MNIKQNIIPMIAVIVAVAVVISATIALGGFGTAQAAITYDDDTITTSSTSDLVGGEIITGLDDETKNKTIEVQSDNATDGDSFTLRVTVADSTHPNNGRVIYEDSSTTWTATNATSGNYKATYNHAELFSELERGINEDTPVDVTVVAEEGTDAEESTTINVLASNGDTQSVDVITKDDLNNTENVQSVSKEGSAFGWGAENYAKASGERSINGSATDVRVVLASDTVEQQYVDKYDAEGVSSTETLGKMNLLEGDRVDTYAGSAPSDVDSNSTYAVFERNPANGDNAHMTYTLGDDYSDKKSVEYTSYGIVEMPWTQSFDIFGLDIDVPYFG